MRLLRTGSEPPVRSSWRTATRSFQATIVGPNDLLAMKRNWSCAVVTVATHAYFGLHGLPHELCTNSENSHSPIVAIACLTHLRGQPRGSVRTTSGLWAFGQNHCAEVRRCRRTARAAPSGRPGAAGGTEAGRDGSGAQLRHVSGSSGHIGRPPGWMMETFTQVGRRPAGSPKMHRAAASYVCPLVRIYKQYFVRLRMTRAHALRIVELTAARPCSAIGEADNIMLEQRWPEQQEALRRVQKSAPSGCRPTRSPQILRRMTRRVARQHPRGDRWGSVCREREYGSLNA